MSAVIYYDYLSGFAVFPRHTVGIVDTCLPGSQCAANPSSPKTRMERILCKYIDTPKDSPLLMMVLLLQPFLEGWGQSQSEGHCYSVSPSSQRNASLAWSNVLPRPLAISSLDSLSPNCHV